MRMGLRCTRPARPSGARRSPRVFPHALVSCISSETRTPPPRRRFPRWPSGLGTRKPAADDGAARPRALDPQATRHHLRPVMHDAQTESLGLLYGWIETRPIVLDAQQAAFGVASQ